LFEEVTDHISLLKVPHYDAVDLLGICRRVAFEHQIFEVFALDVPFADGVVRQALLKSLFEYLAGHLPQDLVFEGLITVDDWSEYFLYHTHGFAYQLINQDKSTTLAVQIKLIRIQIRSTCYFVYKFL
jgi:hypothetical protein